jgi:type III pantothenate kinase
MTVLLVDIGNTRVKWARLRGTRMGKQYAAANAGWGVEDYAQRVIGRSSERVIVSSVARPRVNKAFVAAAKRAGVPEPEFAASQRRAGGITTAYLEPWRLGVDRFIGAIGARYLADGKPVCVVNVGTAITIDLVDASGRHRGGAIVPGPALMVDSLLEHTSGIRRRAQGGANGVRSLFARTTRTAIGQGSRYAAAAVIDRAVEEARNDLGRRPVVLLTGGGSTAVKPLLRTICIRVPDLVLRGLAVWGGVLPSRGA